MKFTSIDKIKIKSDTVELIGRCSFSFLITLNFNDLRNDLVAQDLIRRFLNSVNCEVFGKRSKKALVVFCALEKNSSGAYHLHLMTEDPTERVGTVSRRSKINYREIIKTCWESIDSKTARISTSCPDQSSWFKNIYDQNGVIEYLSKEIDGGRMDVIQWDLVNLTGRKQF